MPLLEPGQGGGGWNVDAFGRNRNDPNYAQMVAQDDARRAAQVAGDQAREQAAQSEIQQLQSQGSTYWGGQPSTGSAFGAGAGGVPTATMGPAGGGPNFTNTMGMPGGQAGMTGRYLPELMPGGSQMPGGAGGYGGSPYGTGYAPQPQAQPGGGGASYLGGGYGGGYTGSPYQTGVADEITRRATLARDQGNNAIRSNAVGVGGLGGSRQGVAEGINNAMSNDSLQGNLASMYSQDWNQSQNRGLQQYGMNQNYDVNQTGLRNNFYTSQRGQDLQSTALGADMYGKAQSGMWQPLKDTSQIYSPYTGFGTTTQTQNTGGGVQGALGGALGAAQLWKAWQ